MMMEMMMVTGKEVDLNLENVAACFETSTSHRYRDGSLENSLGTGPDTVKEMLHQFFDNVESGKKSWNDPRLTSEALREKS
jgi:hypothetical protein